ncbi:MAG: diaminopimelate epimerase [Candidatus Omnitrophota bacterium]
MKSIKFVKMQGAGNDFILLEDAFISGKPSFSSKQLVSLAKKICDRKYGVGADGLLLVTKSVKADARMRIFNADGSEPDMCGNGARCFASYVAQRKKKSSLLVETRAGFLKAQVQAKKIKLNMTEPKDLKLGLSLEIDATLYKADYVNTGVPHVVVMVDDLENFHVQRIGRLIREHTMFQPAGANVNFIKIVDSNFLHVRTYERGVENETLACGTGSVASAIIAVLNAQHKKGLDGAPFCMRVKTKSGELLKVYFKVSGKIITDVWLEGEAKVVFKGEYYV